MWVVSVARTTTTTTTTHFGPFNNQTSGKKQTYKGSSCQPQQRRLAKVKYNKSPGEMATSRRAAAEFGRPAGRPVEEKAAGEQGGGGGGEGGGGER